MSYANGADALGNATATSPETRLGGDGSGPFQMTAVEIAVICIVFAVFSAIVALVIYCRVLHQRREADWRRERKRRAQAFFGGGGRQGIELVESGKDAGNSSTSVERLVGGALKGGLEGESGGGGKTVGKVGGDLEAVGQGGAYFQRKSIWKYVHWRDQSALERRRHAMPDSEPRRLRWARACRRSEPDEEVAAPKNPYV